MSGNATLTMLESRTAMIVPVITAPATTHLLTCGSEVSPTAPMLLLTGLLALGHRGRSVQRQEACHRVPHHLTCLRRRRREELGGRFPRGADRSLQRAGSLTREVQRHPAPILGRHATTHQPRLYQLFD